MRCFRKTKITPSKSFRLRNSYRIDSRFLYEVLKEHNTARWLSWLERRPVTAEVVGSSPIRVVFPYLRDLSSAGRARALQARGHRFEPCRSHPASGRMACRCGSTAEQLICNQQVNGSSPFIGFPLLNGYGWFPEWPKGTDCKSAANCFGGSNPPPPI